MLTTSHIQLDIWRFLGDPKGSQKPPFPIRVQGWSSWKLWLFYTIFMLKIPRWVFKVIWNFASAYFWGQTSSILSITTIEPISDIWSNRPRNIGAMLLISKIHSQWYHLLIPLTNFLLVFKIQKSKLDNAVLSYMKIQGVSNNHRF